MPKKTPGRNLYKKKGSGGVIATLVLVFLVICVTVIGYLSLRAKPAAVPPVQQQVQAPPPVLRPMPPRPKVEQLPEKPAEKKEHVYPPVKPPLPPPAVKQAHQPQTPESNTAHSGLLAILVDDMGTTIQEAHLLAAIVLPLTFSIIPGLPQDQQVASFAASRNIETLIHIPMQSKEWPQRRLEANGLLVAMPAGDIRQRVDAFIKAFPRAVGANNHTGSEFTEHDDVMRVVLTQLKGKGLFFVDSVTSQHTVGLKLAQEMGLRSGRRNVFLDNEQNDAYIRGQLAQAVSFAKRTGSAIAICHPHPATISTLAAALPGLKKQGITLVPVSLLVR